MNKAGQITSIPNSQNISRVEMDNGIVLLVYENSAVQSVNVMGSLHAGSLYEAPERSGLAAFVASALMTGTRTRSFDAIHAALEDNGADLGCRSHIHKLGFSGKSLAEDLTLLLETAGDVLRNPIFPTIHVERLRGEKLTWLQYSSFDTRYRAAKAMREALYPASHPYHRGTYGMEDTIEAISQAELKEFHRKQYGPRGMIVVIVGAVEASRAAEMVDDAFGDWLNPAQPDIPRVDRPEPTCPSDRYFVFVPGKTQCDISMGAIGPARNAANYLPAQLANSVLGEFGMMGRIGKRVREEKGLAYYAFSRLGGGHGPDPWTINAGVNPENVDLAIGSILDEIETLITCEVSDDDLADNQSYFAGRLPLRLESNEGIASAIHTMESFDLGLDYLANYKDMIDDIDKTDLLAAAKQYLRPENMVIAIAGPEIHAAGSSPSR